MTSATSRIVILKRGAIAATRKTHKNPKTLKVAKTTPRKPATFAKPKISITYLRGDLLGCGGMRGVGFFGIKPRRAPASRLAAPTRAEIASYVAEKFPVRRVLLAEIMTVI